jgi:pilus assembly protein Flp/PilA
MRKLFVRLFVETEGQDLIEYALLGAVVALGALVGMRALAGGINQEFSNISTSLTSAS